MTTAPRSAAVRTAPMCSVSMLPTMNPPPWIMTTPGTGAPMPFFGRYTRTLTSGSPAHPGIMRSSMSSMSACGTSRAISTMMASNPARAATGSLRSNAGMASTKAASSGSIMMCPPPLLVLCPCVLLGLHPNAGVDADGLGVHVRVRQQLDGERGELVGTPEAVWEQHVLRQFALEGLGALSRPVDGRVDQPGQDGVDPDADHREVSRHREGEADDAALGRRVRGLADLAVLGR